MHGTIYEFEGLPHLAPSDRRELPVEHLRTPGGSRGGPPVPLVGIIRNPRSHRNKARAPELADRPDILTETPRTRKALCATLAEFARRGIDYLVVDGGDGTVRDVLTCGAALFDRRWPTLIVLPRGKTNALTVDLGVPGVWSLTAALDAARSGRVIERRPMRISRTDGADAGGAGAGVLGFLLGAGAFARGTDTAQQAHKLGAFNSFAVGLTILWIIVQSVFGGARNPFRAATPLRLRRVADGSALPHSRQGMADERYMMIATTFERFPLGVRPFGPNPSAGLKLGLIDRPSRRVMGALPLILAGLLPSLSRSGVHRVSVDAVDMDIGGSFILDGESFPAGRYRLEQGPLLRFVVP